MQIVAPSYSNICRIIPLIAGRLNQIRYVNQQPRIGVHKRLNEMPIKVQRLSRKRVESQDSKWGITLKKDKMKTIVYLTVNTKNHKIYIGVHSTEDPNVFDGYLGCGCSRNIPSSYKKSKTAFQYALNKYGVDAFRRYTIAVFDNEEDAFALEEKIVTEEFIRLPFVYNSAPGGKRGPDQSKIVHMYDLNGNYVKTFNSYKEASLEFNCSPTCIEIAVKNKATSQSHLWSTSKTDILNTNEFHVQKTELIYEYDSEGNYIAQYESRTDIIKKYNIDRAGLNRAIQGLYKINGKFYTLYKVDKIDPIKTKGQKIYLYNIDGSFYKEFSSSIECSKEFGEKNSSKLMSCVRLGRLFHDYQVSFEKVDSMKVFVPKNKKQKVLQYDQSGNLIKTWDSITEAVNVFGTGVRRCIKGQYRHCKNFIFKLES